MKANKQISNLRHFLNSLPDEKIAEKILNEVFFFKKRMNRRLRFFTYMLEEDEKIKFKLRRLKTNLNRFFSPFLIENTKNKRHYINKDKSILCCNLIYECILNEVSIYLNIKNTTEDRHECKNAYNTLSKLAFMIEKFNILLEYDIPSTSKDDFKKFQEISNISFWIPSLIRTLEPITDIILKSGVEMVFPKYMDNEILEPLFIVPHQLVDNIDDYISVYRWYVLDEDHDDTETETEGDTETEEDDY